MDADLAQLYGVETRALIQALKRNKKRFPTDFVFQMTKAEFDRLRSQIVISNGRGGRRSLPYAFTEHGVIMAANMLNSVHAVEASVEVVRAFVRLRQMVVSTTQPQRVGRWRRGSGPRAEWGLSWDPVATELRS